ncbi:ku70-like protein [Fomitiporia mediterranea MF3/22]|uniref:ku70-like protein n=1 Tax=Fomitiporia mediterranea (strain MF3/22) TaxID=694068 RepID=UPI00044084BB|nr:ku70-like protein [Fomitiporia mediterranea MF3/22]EJD06786.1 ku70-like protein [Fomitiporia mediterranea MF3/22]
MPPFEDWNKVEEDEDDELQDTSIFEGKRDIILFAIDCSESMQAFHDDSNKEGSQTSHLFAALQAAMKLQKRKVVVGPNDAAGILLFNTSRKSENMERGATEYKSGTFVYEPVGQIDAPKIQNLIQLLHEAKDNHKWLRYEFPPSEKQVPLGDVFTSCNWALRDGMPKSGIKRIFLITDEDDPHPGAKNAQLVTSAQTTLLDLTQAGVSVEPFFISTEEKSFDPTKFYSAVLGSSLEEEAEESDGLLSDAISVSRIDDLLAQMRFREMPKRALFSIPFELGDGFVIGVKGYGLVTEQKKGHYKYFMDMGDRLEVVEPKTLYVDENEQREIDKTKVMYGMQLGPPAEENEDEEYGVRVVPKRSKVFYTAEEVRAFRTLGLSPGLKLLGFKDETELAIEDNVRHSLFIYPDEQNYSGSKRTFTALLKTLKKKRKIGLVRALLRSNSSPMFCALCPQEEKEDENGFVEPAGFHLIPYPFADDLRAAPIEQGVRASTDALDVAKQWISKLQIKSGGYPPDANPNPALAFHYAQLEASAFREEYDPDTFKDPTLPKLDMIHKRAGPLIKEWKKIVGSNENANTTFIQKAGTKRKADTSVLEAEIRSKNESGQLGKLKVDQLKEFLKSKSLSVSGKKSDLLDRVVDYLESH